MKIYTDGACSGNPGPGGWAVIIPLNKNNIILRGGKLNTTNNEMELIAVVEALQAIDKPTNIEIYTDSAYIEKAFNENWLDNWQKNNWKTANKTPVKNMELWKELLKLTKKHKVNFIKVKGHSDDKFNNLCDIIAVEESLKYKEMLENK